MKFVNHLDKGYIFGDLTDRQIQKLTTATETCQPSGKSLLNLPLHLTKDSLPFGKLENILSTEFNSIQKRTVLNGKSMLTDPTMLSKLSKLCQTNSLIKRDFQRIVSLLMMNTKNTAFTTSKLLPLLSPSPEFTDSTKLSLQDLNKKPNRLIL